MVASITGIQSLLNFLLELMASDAQCIPDFRPLMIGSGDVGL
jgi:hypothetical protein